KYIQHNGPTHLYWMAFDIDRPGASIDWSDRGAPAPNLTVKNQANGHAHALYALSTAVRTAPDGRVAPLRYAAAVENALCGLLDADRGYAGLIVKNPLHKHWQVHEWNDRAYELGELADYLDLSTKKPKIIVDYGLGRNCTLFEELRKWAYRAQRQGWPDYRQWLDACLTRAQMINLQFTSPLPLSEIRATATSVAKWTSKRMNQGDFEYYVESTHTSEIQSYRGKLKGKTTREQGIELLQAGKSIQEVMAITGASQATVYRWTKR
ncbi:MULTISPECIES: replication initiation protein, partial [Pseudomonas]